MKQEYITEITDLLPLADVELLDFIYQLLQKSIEQTLTSSEMHPQPA
jgi:hypothetical protein